LILKSNKNREEEMKYESVSNEAEKIKKRSFRKGIRRRDNDQFLGNDEPIKKY